MPRDMGSRGPPCTCWPRFCLSLFCRAECAREDLPVTPAVHTKNTGRSRSSIRQLQAFAAVTVDLGLQNDRPFFLPQFALRIPPQLFAELRQEMIAVVYEDDTYHVFAQMRVKADRLVNKIVHCRDGFYSGRATTGDDIGGSAPRRSKSVELRFFTLDSWRCAARLHRAKIAW